MMYLTSLLVRPRTIPTQQYHSVGRTYGYCLPPPHPLCCWWRIPSVTVDLSGDVRRYSSSWTTTRTQHFTSTTISSFLFTTIQQRIRSNSSSSLLSSSRKIVIWPRGTTTPSAGLIVLVITIFGTLSTSVYIRQWRQEQMNSLVSLQQQSIEHPKIIQRNISELTSTIRRAGLMGSWMVVTPPQQQEQEQQPIHRRRRRAQSVLEELQHIRQWHIQHGYYGGIVVRDITPTTIVVDNNEKLEPPPNHNENMDYSSCNNNNRNDTTKKEFDLSTILARFGYDYWQQIWNQWQIYIQQQSIARRECYYIYYEICPITGRTTQQIYIRGTTLWIDIVTCLLTYMMYDPELQCHVHYGFVQQTHRILHDILPLLSKDKETNIELCGHSLGGAVASILAMKLHLRGYHITKLTTIGEPAYLWFPRPYSTRRHHYVRSLLPKDHIRIEHDCNVVPYLPPFGSHVGNKIWITRCSHDDGNKNTSSNHFCSSSSSDTVSHQASSTDTTTTTTDSSATISSSSNPTTKTIPKTNVYWVESSISSSTSNTISEDGNDQQPLHNNNNNEDGWSWWWWTESLWINVCVPEVLRYYRTSHRISNYITAIQQQQQVNDSSSSSSTSTNIPPKAKAKSDP